MRSRLYDYICILVLLEILQPSIYYARVVNNARRTKREISNGNADYAKQVQRLNLEGQGRADPDDPEDDTYLRERREISKRSADRANTDPRYDSHGELIDRLDSMEEPDYAEETDEDATKQKRDNYEISRDLVRLPRDASADDLDRYADRDVRSNLYDDYETKDVAKRGALGGPDDYEEMEEDDDPPGIPEGTAALNGRETIASEIEKGETRSDARVKRDQAVSDTLDRSKSSAEGPGVATEDRRSRQFPRTELSRGFNEASEIKGPVSNVATSRLSDSTREIKETADLAASSKKDESRGAEYEKRVEDEIQRKIDSIKEEIKRDVDAQRRIRDIEENNARYDELQDRERAEESSFQGETIAKRQTAAERAIREADASSNGDNKRSSKGEQREKLQRRAKESENRKRRSPSKGLAKKKRERVEQTFVIGNDRAKRRRSRSYADNGLSMDPNSDPRLQTNDKISRASLSGEDANNGGERDRATAENPDSLVSLAKSSQELSPRLAREYKEAFGGLQSEPGSALARFKRIKRVLGGPDEKTSNEV